MNENGGTMDDDDEDEEETKDTKKIKIYKVMEEWMTSWKE